MAETQKERLQFRLNAILSHLVYSWETGYAKTLDALRFFPRRFPRAAMANEDNKEMRQVQIKPGQMRFDVEFIVLDGPLDERPVVQILRVQRTH